MRTKTLLLTAVLATAGALSSMAQSNVFSVNVVGYINVPITNGYNLIANQLNLDGTNNINAVIPLAPDGSQFFGWNPGVQNFEAVVQYIAAGNGWYDQFFNPATNLIGPGRGFFIYNPSTTTNITLAGSVVQGTNVTKVNGIYGFYSVIPPIASGLDTNNFPAQDGMQYFEFQNGNYTQPVQYIAAGLGWYDQFFTQKFPTPAVGKGFVIYNPLTNNYNWSQQFNVQ